MGQEDMGRDGEGLSIGPNKNLPLPLTILRRRHLALVLLMLKRRYLRILTMNTIAVLMMVRWNRSKRSPRIVSTVVLSWWGKGRISWKVARVSCVQMPRCSGASNVGLHRMTMLLTRCVMPLLGVFDFAASGHRSYQASSQDLRARRFPFH